MSFLSSSSLEYINEHVPTLRHLVHHFQSSSAASSYCALQCSLEKGDFPSFTARGKTIQLRSLEDREMARASHAAKSIIVEVLMLSLRRILAAQLPPLAEEEGSMYDSTRLGMQYIIMAIALENGLTAEEIFTPPQRSLPTYAAVLATPPPKRYHPSSPMELPARILLSDTVGVPPLPQKKRMYRATAATTSPTRLVPCTGNATSSTPPKFRSTYPRTMRPITELTAKAL